MYDDSCMCRHHYATLIERLVSDGTRSISHDSARYVFQVSYLSVCTSTVTLIFAGSNQAALGNRTLNCEMMSDGSL